MEKQETVFRQKSIDKISSPEQLDKYLRVTTPNVWIILVGIIVILVGAIIWSAYGKLTTYVNTACLVSENNAYCYVREEDSGKVEAGMEVEIDSNEISFVIFSVDTMGINIPDSYGYLQHLLGVTSSDYVFEVLGQANIPDGFYQGRIVIESISPLKFIYN